VHFLETKANANRVVFIISKNVSPQANISSSLHHNNSLHESHILIAS